jgi:hypothetical protein
MQSKLKKLEDIQNQRNFSLGMIVKIVVLSFILFFEYET